MFIMQNAAIEMHWLMVNHTSRLKKAEKPKMLVWRTEFGRGVIFFGKLNKPCGYWFCQKWLLIISKHPKKSSEWCYFDLTPPTDHGYILRRSPPPAGQTHLPCHALNNSTERGTSKGEWGGWRRTIETVSQITSRTRDTRTRRSALSYSMKRKLRTC